MDPVIAKRGLRLFDELLARAHLCAPSDTAAVVAEVLESTLDVSAVTLSWVDLEQSRLRTLPRRPGDESETKDVDGTLAGRCFTSTEILTGSGHTPGTRRVYVPIVDGTERIGVLEVDLPVPDGGEPDQDVVRLLERYAHASAQLLISKRAYGDALHLAQRSRPMDLGAELLWTVLPPATFATEGLVISGILQPAYENGGDAFDYAVNGDRAHLAVFDAAGHGLHAARMSTFTVAAYRHSRRTGLGLADTYAGLDSLITEQFGNEGAFVTAILAELDRSTGALSWVNAGHPPPLLLRQGHVVKVLEAESVTPLGMPMFGRTLTEGREHLEPGDMVVLYTDGVIEARAADGSQVGVDGLTDFLHREAGAQQPAPETLRRLQRSLAGAYGPDPDDDATVLLAHWEGDAEQALVPPSV